VFELLAAIVVAAAVWWAGVHVARTMAALRSTDVRGRSLQLMALFAPGIAAAADDPRALLTWQPLATAARKLFPDEFASLDQAAGGPFPFSAQAIESAHARWSADWLAWERTHDAEYKLKASETEDQLKTAGNPAIVRSRLEAVEREKIERYQQRYSDYVRVSKALQAMMKSIA
jgi:hypothetical protein